MSGSESRKSRRDALRARRKAIGASDRLAAAEAIAHRLGEIPAWLAARRVAGYWAIADELPLAAISSGLRRRGQTYCLPVIDDNRLLRFASWTPGDALVVNRYGIPEPDVTEAALLRPMDLDVVLVPLLGFDRAGYRLGYGGGYYDRSFAFLLNRNARAKPLLIGIGYRVQELADVEPESWDVRVDMIVTETEAISCMPEIAP